jgi:uncharacterized membrane protein AbrB (regulator of aidB expression)
MKKLNHFVLKIKKLWYCFYILICVSIVFGVILLYLIFKFKNNFENRKVNISRSMAY